MITSKKNIILICLNLLYYNISFAQLPACANVFLGPDTTLSCTSNCIILEAEVTEVGLTNSYSVSSINYAPPYPFDQGTPIIAGYDDVWSEIIPLPFTFCFFGNTYDKIVIGVNGVITFDTTLASPPGFNFFTASQCDWPFSQSIPNSTGLPYRNTINGAYHDINPEFFGDITIDILGSYPCRTFVVNYNEVPHYDCNIFTTTQQIVLYETTNIIDVYIQDKPSCNSWNNGNAVIGIQNATGTIGYTPPARNTGSWATNNEAWRFSPNGSTTSSIEWFDNVGTSLGNSDTLVVCPSSTTSYFVNVTYDICDGTQVIVSDDININVGTNISIGTSSVSSCNDYTWEGQTITQTGTLTYTYEGVNGFGCDSVHTLNVQINSPTSSTTSLSSCDQVSWNGQTLSTSGNYSFITTNSNGCDSIANLNLTINPVTSSYTSLSSCIPVTWNEQTYTNTGNYSYLTTNSNGCDSIANLSLTINSTSSSITTINSCVPVTWNGQTYTSSGNYSYLTTNSNGCDSIANLSLTINSASSSITTINSCIPITWNGQTLSTSGNYSFLTTNSNGCDSIANLSLTINSTSSSITTVNSCVPITWNGQTYTSSGNYSYLTTNSNGCDSIANLSLTISPLSLTANVSIDACNEYYWNGFNYENSGIYSFTTTNNLGCDSTTVLSLNIFDDEIFIPNTFTPNKTDNINNRFYIHKDLTNFKMSIHNRWGEEIFYTEDSQLGWDGKYKNRVCQEGLYVWMIKYDCGKESKIKTGYINLLK